ncbi:MAG: isoprenylcysteine carboxylmethyltransferase family protein, partial [Robiginitomaculum sp.]|nr:isoprenylcysteine carboxylmethyltransferase family protein [Robiginitomaculum sp.]
MTNQSKTDTPAVHIPPPIIVAVFLGIGIWSNKHFHFGFGEFAQLVQYLGWGLLAASIIIGLWCALLYRAAKTSILPHTADNTLMDHGPFSFSRNPIYLAMVIMFLGLCFVYNAPLALVFILPTILGLRFYVIVKEEAYLERRFGKNYLEYKSRVRRWL